MDNLMNIMQENGSLLNELIHSELEEYLIGGHDNYCPESSEEPED